MPSLDDELREAVREVMESQGLNPAAIARVEMLADRKAHAWRAPFAEKIRRIKESGLKS